MVVSSLKTMSVATVQQYKVQKIADNKANGGEVDARAHDNV